MIKKLICFFFGHKHNATREYYGDLTNGQKLYAVSYSDCARCGKEK